MARFIRVSSLALLVPLVALGAGAVLVGLALWAAGVTFGT
jgi:hypothetical protein